jgi:AcrR family transcriptional regulator
MDGFERRKKHSKDEIRKAAWELFSQFGVDKVSMMDIARKAGVSQATIYNNFGSKEALVREFVSGMVEGLVSRAQQIVAPQGSFQEKMNAFFQFISAMMAGGKPASEGAAVFASSLDLQNDPEIREIRMKAEEEMIALLLGLIEEGKQQGQVDPDLSEEALLLYFTAFMNIFPSAEFQRQYSRQPDLVGELGSLMLYGLNRRSKTE